MAKIYAKRYQKRIELGEITLAEAKELVREEVPTRWQADTIELLNEWNPTAF